MRYNPYDPQNNNQPYSPPPGPQYPLPPGSPNPYYPYAGMPMPPYAPPPKKKRKGKVLLILLPILLIVCSLAAWFGANMDISLGDGGIQITGFLAQQRLQATATYYANHYPFGTTLLFEDNLNTPSGKWKTGSNCANQGGALHVTETQAQVFHPCMSTYTPFFDSSGKYTYEVTIRQMEASAVGLIFRGESDQDYYHTFLISSNGTYTLAIYDSLDRHQPLEGIKSGRLTGQLSFPLRIGVVVIDKQSLGLYVNSVELATVNDTSPSHAGELGVVVLNNQGTKAAWADFVDAKCWAHRSDL